jgi:hypothetical protein
MAPKPPPTKISHKGVRLRETMRDDPLCVGTPLLVGIVISSFVHGGTGQIILGQQTLSDITGLKPRTIRDALKVLRELGYIETRQRMNAASLFIGHCPAAALNRAHRAQAARRRRAAGRQAAVDRRSPGGG